MFLGNTPRNLVWNNIGYVLYYVVQRAIPMCFDLAQGSQQVTCTKKKKNTAVYSKSYPCLPI